MATKKPSLQVSFARNVKTRRRELRLTQADVAKRMGVTQARIAEIETGNANPRLSTIGRIAKALRTTASQLTLEPPRYGSAW